MITDYDLLPVIMCVDAGGAWVGCCRPGGSTVGTYRNSLRPENSSGLGRVQGKAALEGGGARDRLLWSPKTVGCARVEGSASWSDR